MPTVRTVVIGYSVVVTLATLTACVLLFTGHPGVATDPVIWVLGVSGFFSIAIAAGYRGDRYFWFGVGLPWPVWLIVLATWLVAVITACRTTKYDPVGLLTFCLFWDMLGLAYALFGDGPQPPKRRGW